MPSTSSDPAAIFAIATSLWDECHNYAAADSSINLSDAHSGMDGLMREVMRIAMLFESWACENVDFNQLTEVWPYLLEDRFGTECLSILLPEHLRDFNKHDCRRVAARLRLTFRSVSTRSPRQE
ncbi:MAG TPA: hypothetical protein VMM36_20155 [Opitutaceae bacterium]|nr:hypothetical protein [Opitutaceae bacterium]